MLTETRRIPVAYPSGVSVPLSNGRSKRPVVEWSDIDICYGGKLYAHTNSIQYGMT